MEPTQPAPLVVSGNAHQLSITRAPTEHVLTQTATPNKHPFIHPLSAPDGWGVLTEDAPAHHPWQRGLYTGLKRVNGVGFWEEGVRGKATDGTFHPRLEAPTITGASASWQVETAWRAPGGQHLLTEEQVWRLTDQGESYILDLNWALQAAVDLDIEKAAYGGPFLRMPYRPATGGDVLTSEGGEGLTADAAPARWLGLWMPLEGRTTPAGVVWMDHPGNPAHPVPWRVDGELGVSPSRCIAEGWRVRQGVVDRYLYRLLAFAGAPDVAGIERAWEDFAETAGP